MLQEHRRISPIPAVSEMVETQAPKFLLSADGNPIDFFQTLEEAKLRADGLIKETRKLRIESFVAPAPSTVWTFDYEVHSWVQST